MEILQGDCLAVLKTIPERSIQMCVTSPPYYGLRDYGVDGQIGLEDTPQEFISRLVDVFREVRRVLKDDGTLWVNIGDSYCNSNGYARASDQFQRKGRNNAPANDRDLTRLHESGLKTKDLIGIPWMLAFALRADGWYLRQDIIWHKPNPMPESVKDRCTKAHEYIFLLSKSKKYYFDSKSISEPVAQSTIDRLQQNIDAQAGSVIQGGGYSKPMKACMPKFGGSKYGDSCDTHFRTKSGREYNPIPCGDGGYPRRNKRDVWTVTTKPYKGAHFATFPEDLIEPCILAGSREGDLVLDPFNGAATTGVVCKRLKREYLGIELNPEYVDISNERLQRVGAEIYMEQNQFSFLRRTPNDHCPHQL